MSFSLRIWTVVNQWEQSGYLDLSRKNLPPENCFIEIILNLS